MRIIKYRCPNCDKEHTRKIYTDKSEGVAQIFVGEYFPSLWEKKKEMSEKLSLEEFCKELILIAIYNYHKNRRKIKVEKDSIEDNHRT